MISSRPNCIPIEEIKQLSWLVTNKAVMFATEENLVTKNGERFYFNNHDVQNCTFLAMHFQVHSQHSHECRRGGGRRASSCFTAIHFFFPQKFTIIWVIRIALSVLEYPQLNTNRSAIPSWPPPVRTLPSLECSQVIDKLHTACCYV